MYITYALVFLLIGGLMAVLMRIQLAILDNHFVSPQVFNRLFTMAAPPWCFSCGMPILLGLWQFTLVPLMIGVRETWRFPDLNASSFWISASANSGSHFSYLGGDNGKWHGLGSGCRLVRLLRR